MNFNQSNNLLDVKIFILVASLFSFLFIFIFANIKSDDSSHYFTYYINYEGTYYHNCSNVIPFAKPIDKLNYIKNKEHSFVNKVYQILNVKDSMVYWTIDNYKLDKQSALIYINMLEHNNIKDCLP